MLLKGPMRSTMMMLATLLLGFHLSQPPQDQPAQSRQDQAAPAAESHDPLFQRLKEGFEKNPRRPPSEILQQFENASPSATQTLVPPLAIPPVPSVLSQPAQLSEAEWEAMEHLLTAARLLQASGSHPGSLRTDSNRSDSNRSESNRSESNRSESNRSESNRSESNRADIGRAEGGHAASGHAVTPQQLAAQLRQHVQQYLGGR